MHSLMHVLAAMTGSGDERGVPRGLLQALLRLYDQYVKADEARRKAGQDVTRSATTTALWGPWLWRVV